MDNNYYIYFHINPIDESVFYVGKGKNSRATSKYRRSSRWNNYINKYGYDIEIKEMALTEIQAFEREVFWIKKLGRLDLNEGKLINMNDGGLGGNNNAGRKFSDEWIENMRLAQIGKKRPNTPPRSEESKLKTSQSLKGRIPYWLVDKKLSPEHIEKIASKNRGKKRSQEAKDKTKATLEKMGVSYFPMSDIGYNSMIEKLSKRFSGEGNPRFGAIIDNELREKIRQGHKNGDNPQRKAIIKLSISGEFIEEFRSIRETLDSLNVKAANRLIKCLTGKIEIYKGFKWMYKSDYELKLAS